MSKDKTEEKNMRKIVKILQKDCLMQPSEIAKKTDLTRQTVYRLIKKMKEKNIIWGCRAIIDPEFLDKKIFFILVKIKPDIPKHESLIKYFNKNREKSLKELPEILSTHLINGHFDFITIVMAENIIEARKSFHLIFQDFTYAVQELYIEESLIPIRVGSFADPNIKEKINKYY